MLFSRVTLAIIKQNIWFSIAVKGVFSDCAGRVGDDVNGGLGSGMGASILVIIDRIAGAQFE